MSLEIKKGKVLAVCSSPVHGLPTYPQEFVKVNSDGIEGDAHSGPLRSSFRNPGTLKPNDRAISIVSQETINEMNAKFGLSIKQGGFNEQLRVEGMGDLSDVGIGFLVLLQNGVELIVTDYAWPCDRLEKFHGEPSLAKYLEGTREDGTRFTKRGILASVIQTGEIRPGEEIRILSPLANLV